MQDSQGRRFLRGLTTGAIGTFVGGGALLYALAPVLAPLFPALPADELTRLLQLCAPAVVLVALVVRLSFWL